MTAGPAIASGWVLDRVFGEPPAGWHPVARFGSLMHAIERRTYRPTRAAGVRHLAIGVTIGIAAGVAAERLVGKRAAAALAAVVSIAGRMLADEADAVLTKLEHGDLAGARDRVRSLVGRDTSDLDETELCRAVIESLAENTVDAVVAPLCWAAVAGAPGVLVHRAANTLDAMVGHRSARYVQFGWASARFDDAMNYVPARVAVLATAALRPRRLGAIARAVRSDARAHPSPNGGVIEAAAAAALGVRLGGENRYDGRRESRGVLSDGPEPDIAAARRAISLTTAVGALVAVGVIASR